MRNDEKEQKTGASALKRDALRDLLQYQQG